MDDVLLRVEDAVVEKEFEGETATEAGTFGDEGAGGGQYAAEFGGARGATRGAFGARAEVAGADLAFACPGHVGVGEEFVAEIGDPEGEVAHAGQAADGCTEVLVGREIARVRVEEAVGGAGAVFEDLKGRTGGVGEGEEAGESGGAVVGNIDGFETGSGTGDQGEVLIVDGFGEGVAEDLQALELAEVYQWIFQRAGLCCFLFESFGLVRAKADALQLQRMKRRR
jgi:hypothetical protein